MSFGFLTGIKTLAQQVSLYGNDSGNYLFLTGNKKWAFGYDGHDSLYANPDADSFLYGGNHDDWLYSDAQADYLHGGSGIDTALYSNSPTGIFMNLYSGIGHFGHAEGDILISIENVTGSEHDDTIMGNLQDNVLRGRNGNDVLLGNGGNDIIEGGNNAGGTYYGDLMEGGADDDTFQFRGPNASRFGVGFDVIKDFNQNGDDTIEFKSNLIQGETVTFSGEASNFSLAGTEVWYQHIDDPTYGEVTSVHAQLQHQTGQYHYYDILLVGHMDLTANDFEFHGIDATCIP